MKIFVSGGAGFIGSNFIRYILKKHKNVRILNYDKLTYSGNLDNLKDTAKDKRYQFKRGDVEEREHLTKILKEFKPDYIVNFAAETHVDRSIHIGAKEFIDTNITGVFNILEIVKANPKIKKFVQVSTDEVYGSLPLNTKDLFREEPFFHPNVPYTATKA